MTTSAQRARFTGLALAVLAIAVATRAEAVTLTPPSLEFTAKPGETINTKIKVINEEAQPVTLFTSTANFKAKDDSGQPEFLFDAPNSDLSSWIIPSVRSITVSPRGNAEVPVSITVPREAEPGGHYAGIFLSTGEPSGGQVKLQSKIATLVIIRVEGEIRENAKVEKFAIADGKKSLSRLPATFELRVANSGNVHVRPQGTLTIKNIFGGETATVSVNEANGAVLPNSVRKFETLWKKEASSQDSAGFFGELKAEWKNFAFGPYTATVNLTYGQSKQPLVATAKFSVMPWRVLTVSIIGIVVMILLVVWGIRRYNAAIITRAERQLNSRNRNPRG